MSDTKGMLPILKSELKTVHPKVYVFGGVVGLVMIGILALGSAAGSAVQSDLNGEKVIHANCTVTDKQVEMSLLGKVPTVTGYEADTNCGIFATDSNFYDTLNKGETYNLTVTVGNWASKPTVVSASPSSK